MNFRQIKSWQWALIVLALLVALDWVIRRPDGQTRALNSALEAKASPALKDYPYPFHVIRVDGKTAVMSTPRNFDVPAFRVLGMLYPKVNVKDANNPEFVALQQELGKVQGEAMSIILAQPGIAEVRWELDRAWLQQHGIEAPGQ